MVGSNVQHLISTVLLLFFFFLSPTFAQQSFRPKALVIPVQKDSFTTLQYIAKINQRTPLVPVNLVVDLGGQFLWIDCQNNYISSTYRPARCRSAQCSLAKAIGCGNCFSSSPKPGCNNNTCSLIPDNTITHTATSGELAEDIISLQSTNGFNPTQSVAVSPFIFSCAPTSLLQGLFGGVSGASGMIGLGRTKISFPSQLASAFTFHKKFAICFSSSDGVVFFGDSPYNIFSSNVDASKLLTFTPLLINPVSTASAFTQGESSSSEYFIGVKTIKIDNKVVPVQTILLTIDNKGVGGTKISTVNPYMVLEASIYKAVTTAFNKAAAARNITSSDSVEPFEFCYDLDDLLMPTIELVMENNVVWKMLGRNSMVNINDAVRCLGFMNGGKNTRTSIVIGGYQLEDNLLQFDLARSRLGFSGLLFAHQTGCVNFDFTSTTALKG